MTEQERKTHDLCLSLLLVARKTGERIPTLHRELWQKVRPPGASRKLARRLKWGVVRSAVADAMGDMVDSDVEELILDGKIDLQEVAEKAARSLSGSQPAAKKREPSKSDPVQEQRSADKERYRKKERDELVRRINEAETRLQAYEAISQHDRVSVLCPAPTPAGKRVGRVILLLSDWHPGDVVELDKVNRLNRFDFDVLTERVAKMVQGLSWTLEMWRTKYELVELVVAILGDMVTGWIHEEQLASTSMTPPEEVVAGGDLLYDAMDRILEEGFPAIHVVCVTGNHGRITRHIHHSNRGTTSYEHILYHDLRRRVQADDPGVSFAIPNSEFCYEQVGPLTVRFGHGDFFRYAGGVGGITIPMNKALYRQDQARHADMTCMGHWHQYMSMPNVALNGSLKGYDSFSQHCGFSPEPPSQTVILIDEARGFPWAKRLWV